jgi:hypothetical protein
MSELEIPDAAYDAAYRAAVIDPAIYSTAPLDASLNAAAPLIVAAELRRLANVTQNGQSPTDDHLTKKISDLISENLRARANELDPQ